MGVTNLWQILSPVQQHRPLTTLKGQTLAVDLSIWVCETQGVKQMQGIVSKPFLRNLFFRISYLVQLGVNLVFVVEGDAPELKWEAMMKRQQTRTFGKPTGGRGRGYRGGTKPNRRNFNSCLRECCEMLDYLGIPYLQSTGEAEAMCAVLNAAGVVDGCITNDGDAFLYGARTVYRNFTLNSKDPHVDGYSMIDIEGQLGLDRDKLVAMALLLGCDYLPKGVPGVGMDKAIKLMTSLQDVSVIKRLHEWRHMTEVHCIDQIEIIVRRKALTVPDFPQQKVIDEFINVKDKCPSAVKKWRRPLIKKIQSFALEKLEWPTEYTLEKVLPLVTLWDMSDILKSVNISKSCHLKPNRIVKLRVRQSVPCFEVEWIKPDDLSDTETEYLTTVEEREIFSKCFPDIVGIYEQEQENKKTKSKGQKKKKGKSSAEAIKDGMVETQTMEEISDDFSNMVLSKEETITKDNCALSVIETCIKPGASSSQIGGKVRDSPVKMKNHLSRDKVVESYLEKFEPIVLSCGSSSSSSSEDETEDEYVPLSQRIEWKLKQSSKLKNDICDKKEEPQKENLVHKNTCVTDRTVNFTNLDSENGEKRLNHVLGSREETMPGENVLPLDVKPKNILTGELPGGESIRYQGKNKQDNIDVLALKHLMDNNMNSEEVKSNASSCTSLNMVSTKNAAHLPVTGHVINAVSDHDNLVSLFDKSCHIEDKSVLNENKNFLNINVKPLTCKTGNIMKNPTEYHISENEENSVPKKSRGRINIKPNTQTASSQCLRLKTFNKVKNPTVCFSRQENLFHDEQKEIMSNDIKPVLNNNFSTSPYKCRPENTEAVSSCFPQKTLSSLQNKQFKGSKNKQKLVSVSKPLSSEGNISSPNLRDKVDISNVTDLGNFGKLNFSVGTPNMSKFPVSEVSPSPSKLHLVNESTPSSLRKPEIYYRSPFALHNHVSPVTLPHGHHMTLYKTPSNEQASFQSTGSPSLFSFEKDIASHTFNTPAGSFCNEDKSLLSFSEARSMSEFGKFQIESSLLKSINLTTEETPEKLESKNLSMCSLENCLAANLETIEENEENISENIASNLNFDSMSKSCVFESNFGFNREITAEINASLDVNVENVSPKHDISNLERNEDFQSLETKYHESDLSCYDPTGIICNDFKNISDCENKTQECQSKEEIKMCENSEKQNMDQNQEMESVENEICFTFGFSIKGSCSVDSNGNIDREVDYKTDRVVKETRSIKDSTQVKTSDDITTINDTTATGDIIKTASDLTTTTGEISNSEENYETVNSDENRSGQVYSEKNELRVSLENGYSDHENDCTIDFPAKDKDSSVSVQGAFKSSDKFDLSDYNQEGTFNRTSEIKSSNNITVLNQTAHFLEKENSPVALADRLKRRLQSAGSVQFVLSDITGKVNTDNRI